MGYLFLGKPTPNFYSKLLPSKYIEEEIRGSLV